MAILKALTMKKPKITYQTVTNQSKTMFEVGQWLDPGYDKSIVDYFPLMFSCNLISFTHAVGFLQYIVVNDLKPRQVYTAPSLTFSLFFALRNKIQKLVVLRGRNCVFSPKAIVYCYLEFKLRYFNKPKIVYN